MADYKPQLEGAESSSELDVPIAVVDHGARFARLIAEIFRQHRERTDQMAAVGDIKATTVEVRKHPFVRIEAVAVGKFHSVMDEAELGAKGGGSAHRGVHVQPQVVLATNGGDRTYRIDRVRGSRSYGRAYEAWDQARLFVGFYLTSKGVSREREILVDFNHTQIFRSE